MKFVITALTILPLLTACGTELSKTTPITAPDVPIYSETIRTKAIEEIIGGQCVTLVEIVKDCKVTRDQSRILKNQE